MNVAEGAPDYFALAGLAIRHHAMALNENDGTATVNVDTLADDVASRLEAVTLVLRAMLATLPLPEDLMTKTIAAIVAAERVP